MAKEKEVWYCKECGTEYGRWQGQCNACKAWNSIVEAPKMKAITKNANNTDYQSVHIGILKQLL